jgi:hypothetical protein
MKVVAAECEAAAAGLTCQLLWLQHQAAHCTNEQFSRLLGMLSQESLPYSEADATGRLVRRISYIGPFRHDLKHLHAAMPYCRLAGQQDVRGLGCAAAAGNRQPVRQHRRTLQPAHTLGLQPLGAANAVCGCSPQDAYAVCTRLTSLPRAVPSGRGGLRTHINTTWPLGVQHQR